MTEECKKLMPGQNAELENKSGSYVSARGIAGMIERLGKDEGRGKDLLIHVDCNMNDIFRAALVSNMTRFEEITK